jgi:hypothetical protein
MVQETSLPESKFVTQYNASTNDEILQKVTMYVNDGWPRKLKNLQSTIKNYFNVREYLSIYKGVLLFNN